MQAGIDASTNSSTTYPSGRTFSPAIRAVAIRNRLGRLARASAADHHSAALEMGTTGRSVGVQRPPRGAWASSMISSAERWNSSRWLSSTLCRPLPRCR